MKHQYQSNYKPNEYCDIIDVCNNGSLKCIITIYGKRGSVKTRTTFLKNYCFSGPWANFHKAN